MRKSLLLAMTASGIFAASTPNAGNILQEMGTPHTPQTKKSIPSFKEKKQIPSSIEKSSIKIMVTKFVITGNTVFSTEVLHALVAKYEGKKLTFEEIEAATNSITEYYRKNRYFVAHAYVPAQEVDNGVITIKVQEGKYGMINIENSSHVKDSVLQAYAQKMKEKDVISLDDIDTEMLLINDLGGARIVSASVFASKKEGTSDFNIVVQPTQQVQAYAMADNYGSIYTGEYRLGAGVYVNSVSGRGDILNISTLHSISGGIRNGQISYSTPLGSSGVKANIFGSITTYKIQGNEYASLEAYGQAGVIGGELTYPLVRTQKHSLYLQAGVKTTHMFDHLNSEWSNKHVDDYTFSIHDIKESTLFNKSANRDVFFQVTRGNVVLDNDTAIINDALLNSKGYFTKYELSLNETLSLTQTAFLKFRMNAQQSDHKNLDSSEEISVGGVNGVRAYGSSELSGDRGILISVEADGRLPDILGAHHQAGIFYDGAKVWQNSVQYSSLSNDDRQLSAVGLNYTLSYKLLNLKASYAHGFGVNQDAQTNPTYNNNRFYIQLLAQF